MTDEMEQLEQTDSFEAVEELQEQQDEQNQPWDGTERRNGKDRRKSTCSHNEPDRRSGEERREDIPEEQ